MADREWFQIENERGASLGIEGTLFGNAESAVDTARKLLAGGTEGTLTVVRYTTQAVKVLSKTSTIQETDLTVTP